MKTGRLPPGGRAANPCPALRPKKKLLLASLALTGALLSACSPTKPPPSAPSALRYGEDAKKAYDHAMEAFDDKNWELAKELFRDVKRKYSYSRYARLAELRMADADWESDKLAEAIAGYRSFVRTHRTDAEVPYARFRIVTGLFNQVSETILLPPAEERDQATTTEAYRELRSFLRDYPRGQFVKEAEHMLRVTTGRLVRHELYVARYYLARDDFDATVARIQYALENFEGSDLDPEAMVLLGETYLKMKKRPEAREAFNAVVERYPASPFVVPARNFLDAMR